MRKDEIASKNISLAFDFLRYLIDHPELLKKLPDGCELEFLDRDFPVIDDREGTESNIAKTFLKVEHTFNPVT